MWLANLNRLPTRTRMFAWGLNVPKTCCFCNNFNETRDHLFLSCSYTASLCRLIFSRLDQNRAPLLTWSELLSWIRAPATSPLSLLRKLATQSLIYSTWRQRNSVIHLSGLAPAQATFKCIDRDIRNVISARRHRRNFNSLMQLWIQ